MRKRKKNNRIPACAGMTQEERLPPGIRRAGSARGTPRDDKLIVMPDLIRHPEKKQNWITQSSWVMAKKCVILVRACARHGNPVYLNIIVGVMICLSKLNSPQKYVL